MKAFKSILLPLVANVALQSSPPGCSPSIASVVARPSLVAPQHDASMSKPLSETVSAAPAAHASKNVRNNVLKLPSELSSSDVTSDALRRSRQFVEARDVTLAETAISFLLESEVKHSRLAMVAALAVPLWERTTGGCALDEISALTSGNPLSSLTLLTLVITGAAELRAISLTGSDFVERSSSPMLRSRQRAAGDLNFDPLGMFPTEKTGRQRMLTSELKHGRVAMLATAAYAAIELVAGAPLVAITPHFFRPFWDSL